MSFWKTKFPQLPIYGWSIIVIIALVVIAAFALADWFGAF